MPYVPAVAAAENEPSAMTGNLTPLRLIAGYAVVLAFMIVAIAVSVAVGNGREAAQPIGGFYAARGDCLFGRLELTQSGEFVNLDGTETAPAASCGSRVTGSAATSPAPTAPPGRPRSSSRARTRRRG